MPAAKKSPPEGEVDRLYGLPLGEFTAARDALAKRLRADGKRDDADRVKGLRKPTAAAWAVNQLSRGQRGRLAELLDVGKKLREAQRRLVEGGKGDVLELSGRERQLVQALARDARAVLREHGAAGGEATLDDVSETLHAAALDADTAADVQQGRLVKERKAIGLGLGDATAPRRKGPAKGSRAQKDARARAARARTDARARERLASAERELEDARGGLRRAQAAARQADRDADKAARRERKAAEALARLRARAL